MLMKSEYPCSQAKTKLIIRGVDAARIENLCGGGAAWHLRGGGSAGGPDSVGGQRADACAGAGAGRPPVRAQRTCGGAQCGRSTCFALGGTDARVVCADGPADQRG